MTRPTLQNRILAAALARCAQLAARGKRQIDAETTYQPCQYIQRNGRVCGRMYAQRVGSSGAPRKYCPRHATQKGRAG